MLLPPELFNRFDFNTLLGIIRNAIESKTIDEGRVIGLDDHPTGRDTLISFKVGRLGKFNQRNFGITRETSFFDRIIFRHNDVLLTLHDHRKNIDNPEPFLSIIFTRRQPILIVHDISASRIDYETSLTNTIDTSLNSTNIIEPTVVKDAISSFTDKLIDEMIHRMSRGLV